jgi:molybdate transport system substrate-binding protein
MSLFRIGHAVRTTIMIALALTALAGVTPAAAQAFCDGMEPVASGTPAASTPVTVPAVAFPEGEATLTVFAAASLTDAFGEIATTLEDAHPGLDVVIEAAGSQTLVTQLQEGANADVLATANAATMTTAVESGLVAGEPLPFTTNRLVIVTPPDNPAGIDSLDDLAGDDVNLVLANASVPAGTYARQAICAWDAAGAAPDGFADGIAANIVSEEEDVRNVLAKVQLGEADAGIVYASDAVASERAGTPLNVIEFPTGAPVAASYPIAALAGGNVNLANAFIAVILSPEGQAVLADYGLGG